MVGLRLKMSVFLLTYQDDWAQTTKGCWGFSSPKILCMIKSKILKYKLYSNSYRPVPRLLQFWVPRKFLGFCNSQSILSKQLKDMGTALTYEKHHFITKLMPIF